MTGERIRVMWISHLPLPSIMEQIAPEDKQVYGGWMQGAADGVLKNKDIDLTFCFQYKSEVSGKVGNLKYYSVCEAPLVRRSQIKRYRNRDLKRFFHIIEEVNPDIIHVFGTESWFQRQFLFMIADNDREMLNKTIVWIQGLVSVYSEVYFSGLTYNQLQQKTFWERLRGTSLVGIQKRLTLNGESERREIKLLKNVFTRTEWDEACCIAENPNIKIHRCNETLRDVFYDEGKRWNIDQIERCSVFISQSSYPIKGFHQALKAIKIVKEQYPSVRLYTTGENLLSNRKSFMDFVREPYYQKLLRKLIVDLGLEENVVFLGTLNAIEMRQRYLESNVFVSSSFIENSPNSVGEAMMLGVPIISSDVGGVASMITHNKDGILYPASEYRMLAKAITDIFSNDEEAIRLANNARLRASRIYDRNENYNKLLSEYRNIINGNDN